MRIIRTLLLSLLGLLAIVFIGMNWGERVDVKFWPFDEGMMFEWPVGFIAPVFFLLGFLPMWFYHRGVKWSLQRKVVSLENAARATMAAKPAETDSSPPATPSPPPPSESDVLKRESNS